MRTKTLLLSAAAIAAGLASSQAQTVFSVNVVGYVNKTLPTTQVFISNPLDNGTNDLNSCLGSVPSKSSASFWNGVGFTPSIKGASWSPNISIPPGTGFFLSSKTLFTNTFIGQVACNISANVTNSLAAGNVAVGSIIPFAGTLNDTNINLLSVPAKSGASFWNGSSFTPSIKGATWSPNLTINPADGFFINSKSANNWVQTLNP